MLYLILPLPPFDNLLGTEKPDQTLPIIFKTKIKRRLVNMGHDIMAHNKEGEMVAYLRYTMSDENSYEIYDLLEVRNFHGGVSGLGEFADFTRVQIEKALADFKEDRPRYPGNEKFEAFKKQEIKEFLTNCLATTRKEDIVQIIFA